MRRSRALKYLPLAGLLAGAGLLFLSWTQEWFTLTLTDPGAAGTLPVPGQDAAPSLSPLALAALALTGALTIAGRAVRIALSALAVILGGTSLAAAILPLADPVEASSAALTAVTGVTGSESLHGLVEQASPTAWPALAIAGAALVIAAGVAALATSRQWPNATRRYGDHGPKRRPRATTPEPGTASDRAIDAWDGLSRGDDPTRDA